MSKRQFPYLAIILLLFTACSEKSVTVIDGNNIDKKANVNTLAIAKEIERTNVQFQDPVDITELKNTSFLTTTSAVLSVSDSKDLCKPFDFGFFGQYQLVKQSKYDEQYIGKLTVYVPKSNKKWDYNNSNEVFAEIQLESNLIKVWNEIGVGSTSAQLKKFLGKNFHYKKGTSIYAEVGEFSIDARFNGDTICELKVGKYCK